MGYFNKAYGVGSYGLAGLEVGVNYYYATLPESDSDNISWTRFGYRTTGTISSLGVGIYAGFAAGGPVGALAGATVGFSFTAAETSYDGVNWWMKEISKGANGYQTLLERGWVPGR